MFVKDNNNQLWLMKNKCLSQTFMTFNIKYYQYFYVYPLVETVTCRKNINILGRWRVGPRPTVINLEMSRISLA